MLLLFFFAYFLTAFVWPSWRVWRETGVNPVVLPRDDSAYGFLGNAFRLLVLLLFAAMALQTWRPDWLDAAFPRFGYMNGPQWQSAGWFLLLAAWLWTLLAQYHMHRSWRIGIDSSHATELVQTGVFRYSRNPIFLGMLLALLGLFLIVPNALLLAVLVVSYIVMAVQVRLEEEFLRSRHAAAYEAYCARTGRWV